MRFIDLRSHRDRANARRWLRQVDSALITLAHLAEPASLALLAMTGLVLPWLEGDLAPIPAFRLWHQLAGLALLLILAWRGAARVAAWGALLASPAGRADAAWHLRHPPIGRLRDAWLGATYGTVLALTLYTGVERFWGARTGVALLPLFSPTGWAALHTMLAPYFWAVLLVLSYTRGRKFARALLAEIRSP
jgi:hypothetical protein